MSKRLVFAFTLAFVLAACGSLLAGDEPSQSNSVPIDSHLADQIVVEAEQTASAALTNTLQPTDTPAPSSTPTSTPAPTETFTPVPTDTFTPEPTHTATPTDIVVGPNDYPQGVNPLTGLYVENPALLTRRPIAVKIVNYPRTVRPQWGLAQADIVFEYYIENGITRFVAIFYGQDVERAGPIRSGRFFDEHVFRMFQSYFVFGSADDYVLDYFLEFDQEIVNRYVLQREDNFEPDCNDQVDLPLCRDTSIDGWNNLFVNTRILNQFLTDRGSDNTCPNLAGLHFDSRIPEGGEDAHALELYVSPAIYNLWQFNAELGQYLRYQEVQDNSGGNSEVYTPIRDPATGDQVTTDNIVVLYVPHEIIKSEPEVVDIQLLTYGPARIFRNGFTYDAYWVRPQEGVLLLFMRNANPFPLQPGRTFFEVVGVTTKITNEEGLWRLEFSMP